jgi:hypothetical protein
MCRIFALDRGETESLLIMESHPDAIFLTDDASARMVAERRRYPFPQETKSMNDSRVFVDTIIFLYAALEDDFQQGRRNGSRQSAEGPYRQACPCQYPGSP